MELQAGSIAAAPVIDRLPAVFTCLGCTPATATCKSAVTSMSKVGTISSGSATELAAESMTLDVSNNDRNEASKSLNGCRANALLAALLMLLAGEMFLLVRFLGLGGLYTEILPVFFGGCCLRI